MPDQLSPLTPEEEKHRIRTNGWAYSPLTRVAYWAEARQQAEAQYRQAIQDAAREGHGQSRIASAAGVTRQAIQRPEQADRPHAGEVDAWVVAAMIGEALRCLVLAAGLVIGVWLVFAWAASGL